MSKSVRVFHHLYSSVERGIVPGRGRGFQTVALSPELRGTEDLAALEKASFYAVSRERRGAGPPPVREYCFSLPSGRIAVGRTVDWGTDSLGREGNYLAHHAVLEREAFQSAGADAFAVMTAARLAAPGTDLTPREVPPATVNVESEEPDLAALGPLGGETAAALAGALLSGGDRPAMLVGPDALTAAAVRALVGALPPEERLSATFCTHFYESDGLRAGFRLVTVGSRAEIPAQRQNYRLFDPASGEATPIPGSTPYGRWLQDRLRAEDWTEVATFQRVLAAVRSGGTAAGVESLSAPARQLLWNRAPGPLAKALPGDARRVAGFLLGFEGPQGVAEALLAGRPEALCGPQADAESRRECLAALRAAAPRAWKRWLREQRADPLVEPFLGDLEPVWLWLARKLPGVRGRE